MLKEAPITVALAIAGLLFWGWGEIGIVPVVVWVLLHLGEFSEKAKADAERRRQKREAERQQRLYARQQELALKEKRRQEAIERARIAVMPPPPPPAPPPPPPTFQQLLDWALADYRAEQERINSAYERDSPHWIRRMNEAERAYDQAVRHIRSRSGIPGAPRSSDASSGPTQLPGG